MLGTSANILTNPPSVSQVFIVDKNALKDLFNVVEPSNGLINAAIVLITS